MTLDRLALASAALGITAIGLLYLVAPQVLPGVYGFDLEGPSEANLFRSGSGSLFVAMGILFGLGAVRPRLTETALVALLTFMGGLAVGRVVSIVVDGWPHPLLVAVLAVEATYAAAAAAALRRSARQSARRTD